MYQNHDYENQSNMQENMEMHSVVSAEQTTFEVKEPKRKKNYFGGMIAIALCFSLLGGVFGAGIMKITNAFGNTSGSTIYVGERSSSLINIANVNTEEEMTAAEIYAAYVNSTVGITTEITTNYFGHTTTSAASGSGFIITQDGYIVTNYHVIEDANTITVTTYDGTAYNATLIGYDESNDLAVLKVDADGLSPVIIGDSDNMNVGDDVIAIGNPLGELTFSLTSGSISALNRKITLSEGVTMELIQTDCAINSGNSGGALFNMYGEVIGITNAKYSSSSSGEVSIDNIGFAIPISNVIDIIESIIETGYISSPYIGVSVSDVGSQYQSFGLPVGVIVESIEEDSPANEAGLQVGDIITAANGEEIETGSDLKSIIYSTEIEDTIVLTIYRQGETLEIVVTVQEQMTPALQTTTVETEQTNSLTNSSQFAGIGQAFNR